MAKARTPHQLRGPKPDRRRALELLASSRDGCTEAILLAHGFTIAHMVQLVRAGLPAVTSRSTICFIIGPSGDPTQLRAKGIIPFCRLLWCSTCVIVGSTPAVDV